MPQVQISKQWEDIPPLVEKIIAAREVKSNIQRGATLISVSRPFRFREFSTEIKVENAAAYRWIRGGVTPSKENQSKIIAWCKKHLASIQ